MKPSIRFSLLGGLIGAVLMFVAVLIIEWQLDKHPALNTQVLDYLQSCDLPIDTLNNDQYIFIANEEKIVFDYFPDDKGFLRFYAIYNMSDFQYEEVAAAAIETTNTKKNCSVVPIRRDDGTVIIQICAESFVSKEEALDTQIIERSLRVISDANLYMLHQLN